MRLNTNYYFLLNKYKINKTKAILVFPRSVNVIGYAAA